MSKSKEIGACGARSKKLHPEFKADPEKSPALQIFLCKEGQCSIRTRGKSHDLIPGTLFFIPPHKEYHLFRKGQGDCHLYYFFLESVAWIAPDLKGDREARRILSVLEKFFSKGQPSFMLSKVMAQELESVFVDMQKSQELKVGVSLYRLKVKSLLFQLFEHLLNIPQVSEAYDRANVDRDPNKYKRGPFEPLINHVHQHYWDKITVETAMEITHMSRSHFHASFRKRFRCSLGEFVLRHRLKNAEKELISKATSPSDVAIKCGFPSLSNFYRCFKKEYGMAPGEYQRLNSKSK